MATRAPTNTSSGKAGIRGSAAGGGGMDDGTVFRSMKEFYWWILIVTLLTAILAFSLVAMLHIDKQLRETKAILQRVEQLEKKNKPKIEPKPDKDE